MYVCMHVCVCVYVYISIFLCKCDNCVYILKSYMVKTQ